MISFKADGYQFSGSVRDGMTMEAQNIRAVLRPIELKQQHFAAWLKRLDVSNQRHDMSLRVEGPVERGRQFEYVAPHWGGHWVFAGEQTQLSERRGPEERFRSGVLVEELHDLQDPVLRAREGDRV
ncbi:Unknown protein sequence [Pseudomonas syringae pv. syringae]|nr:Unknown protein sequence [Pseudomonas syringae pv. syringae]